jgi:hypothetical protein
MTVLILGAGFSKWAAGLPLARELFDFEIEPHGVREEKKLAKVKALKDSWDTEHPGEPAEAFIEFAMRQSTQIAELVTWYIVRRLSDPYIWYEWHSGKNRRHVLMIDENRKWERRGVKEAKSFLVDLLGPHLDGIITTNYDLLIEYALGTKDFNYGEPGEVLKGRGAYPVSTYRNPVTLRGVLSLAKVHGSISWDKDNRYTDGRRGLSGNALIVAPVHGKELQLALTQQWQLAASLIQEATRLIVFGFAFNPYDDELLDFLSSNGPKLKDVLIIDIKPNLDAATRLWPTANIETLLPLPESGFQLREWLMRSA